MLPECVILCVSKKYFMIFNTHSNELLIRDTFEKLQYGNIRFPGSPYLLTDIGYQMVIPDKCRVCR